uniref:Fe-S metabolism associated domain-containing protein n=1 Tax=Cannabis sativa TaxID=3483 RepID=A0A803P738_CANSA
MVNLCFTLVYEQFFYQSTTDLVPSKLQRLVVEFQSFSEPIDRVKRLLQYASLLPKFDDSSRVDSNRVMGCTAQVWLAASLDKEGRMRFAAAVIRRSREGSVTAWFRFSMGRHRRRF